MLTRHPHTHPHQSNLGDQDPAGAAVQCRPQQETVQGDDRRSGQDLPPRGSAWTIQGTGVLLAVEFT